MRLTADWLLPNRESTVVSSLVLLLRYSASGLGLQEKKVQYAAGVRSQAEESPMQPILTSNWACFQWVVVSVAPSILDVVVNFLPQ